jgi:hypothetical protein
LLSLLFSSSNKNSAKLLPSVQKKKIVGHAVLARSDPENGAGMGFVWEVARRAVTSGIEPEQLWKTPAMSDDDDHQDGFYIEGPKRPERSTGRRRNRDENELVARNCRRKV